MSNKDLLKLENEYRNELPKYSEKPKITFVGKSDLLTKKVPQFLAKTTEKAVVREDESAIKNKKGENAQVEMDIYITSSV